MVAIVARRHAVAAVLAAVAAHHTPTELSTTGYEDLLHSEGMTLTPYYDVSGIRTVCIGETHAIEERTYTTQECGEMAVRRIETQFVPPVRRCTKVWSQLGQETKDSIIEFAYNLGPGTYCRSSIVKRLNSGRGIEACDRFEPYSYSRGVWYRGLNERRKREAAKCRRGFA